MRPNRPKTTALSRRPCVRTPKKRKVNSAKPHARTAHAGQRLKMRFLVGDLPAVRGTLSRLAKGFDDGWISERELKTLVYALRSIGSLFLQEKELEIERRLAEIEREVKA